MYLKLVLLAAKTIGAFSRFLGQGSGVMVAGRTITTFAPGAVERLSKDKRVVLISGTNGKSTTAKLIAEVLGCKYSIAHNHTGANLFAGVAAALGANPNAEVAVLEVDELVLPWAISKTNPELVVLLNLGRDQLDRLSEVRMVSNKWRDAMSLINERNQRAQVLASSDDPFVVYAASAARQVIWFSASELGHLDAATCPQCGALLNWSASGESFNCKCRFVKPAANWQLRGKLLFNLQSSAQRNQQIEVATAIPGRAAMQNAARALIVADLFGIEISAASSAIAAVSSVDGRFAIKRIGNCNFRLLLSKNPASWRETLATSSERNIQSVLLAVNANTQDGKDTSWLWDVDFKSLSGRKVLVTGDRRIDVSARLTVDGVEHQLVDDEVAAARVFGDSDADLIASYTAFHRLAKK
jgi:UDP-N-acetylmuramyl tripeptide synthase